MASIYAYGEGICVYNLQPNTFFFMQNFSTEIFQPEQETDNPGICIFHMSSLF